MSQIEIGLSLFCGDNKYHILDNYFHRNFITLNYGDILANLSSIRADSLVECILNSDSANHAPDENNIATFMFSLLELLLKKYDQATSVLVFTEISRYVFDYFKSPDSFWSEITELSNDSHFEEKILENTPYTEFGDSTLAQLILSTLDSVAFNIALSHQYCSWIADNKNSVEKTSKLLLPFEELFSIQKTEVRIVNMEGALKELYNFTSMFSAISFDLYKVLYSETTIKQCKNCKLYFVPENRSDTLYCNRPSPQDKTKSCREYGRYAAYLARSKNNPSVKLYKQIYNLLLNRTKRNPNNLVDISNLKEFKESARDWKLKVKNDSATLQEYTQWLQSQKSKYYSNQLTKTK